MIAIESLTKRYGATVAVDGLSFTAHPGRITALLGPNGAGKTTTLRILLGLARADSGSATVDGRRYTDLPDPPRTVGAVLEEPTFHPGRTARVHLRALAHVAGLAAGRTAEVLRLVELDDAADRRVGGYSLGMRQRLSLAAALLGDPGVLVLDEPQNGLDPSGARWLRELLRSLADAGRTVLVSSHLLAEVSELADDVVIVHRGRLIRQSPLAELLETADAVRARTPDAEKLAGELEAEGFQVTADGPDAVVVRGCPAPKLTEVAVAGGVRLYELAPSRPRLEDVFLQLTDATQATGRGS